MLALVPVALLCALASVGLVACRAREPAARDEPPARPARPDAAPSPRAIADVGSNVSALQLDGRWIYWIRTRGMYGATDTLMRTSLDDGRSEPVREDPGMIGGYAVREGTVYWTRQPVLADPIRPGSLRMWTPGQTHEATIGTALDADELVLADGVLHVADGARIHRWTPAIGAPRLVAAMPTPPSALAVVGDRLFAALYGDDDARVAASIAVVRTAGGTPHHLASTRSPYLLAASPHRLAWASGDPTGGELVIADLDGRIGARHTVGSVQALFVDGTEVWWLDTDDTRPDRPAAIRMLDGDSPPRTIVPDLHDAGGFLLLADQLYWHAGTKLWTMSRPR